jgi:hypothetical protein
MHRMGARGLAAAGLVLSALLFHACASGAGQEAPKTDGCDWGEPRLRADTLPELPQTQDGPLADALPGAWQHTFTKTEPGEYEPLRDTTDIRFVFASAESLIYCQSVMAGAVKIGPRENATPVRFEGDRLVLRSGPGYTALAWSSDVMLWRNERNPRETYVLQRRR